MLKRPALTAGEDEVAKFATDWLRFAASHGFLVAVAELDPEPGAPEWTQDIFDQATQAPFGDDEEKAEITDPSEFPELKINVYRYNDGSGFAVDHDLALNNKASDFTAEFVFKKATDGFLVFLHDLHVM